MGRKKAEEQGELMDVTPEYAKPLKAAAKRYKAALADRQDALKVQALEFVGVVLNAATGGAIDSELLAYALGLSGGLLGIGAYADKRRTDAVLAAQETPAA